MQASVLFVEDDFTLRLALSASLRHAGFELTACASAEEAAEHVRGSEPQLVVLDWNLPGTSGLELLQSWRAAGKAFPVIMLTARDDVSDRVAGLEAGANDYLVKPFATEELLARMRVQLRQAHTRQRQAHAPEPALELSGCTVDLARQVVDRGDGKQSKLTSQEKDLLAYLRARPGTVVSRDDLQREVWGYRGTVRTRAVDNTVLRLRGKVETDPATPRHIITVHGEGYRFEP